MFRYNSVAWLWITRRAACPVSWGYHGQACHRRTRICRACYKYRILSVLGADAQSGGRVVGRN